MVITATQKYTRQTPRKVQLVASAVQKKTLPEALRHLSVMEKRASLVVMKVLRQAIANAINNHGLSVQDLTVKSIQILPGPSYKRFRAVSRGRAHGVIKRTSHIKVELETAEAQTATVASKTSASKTEVKASNSKKVSKKTEKKASSALKTTKVATKNATTKKSTKTSKKK